MAIPGVLSGLNHSLDIHAWGRSRIPRSSSSSWRLLTQSSSHVPSTVTLRLLRRRSSNCLSDSVTQAYFRCGIGTQNMRTIVSIEMVSWDVGGNNRPKARREQGLGRPTTIHVADTVVVIDRIVYRTVIVPERLPS